MRTWVLWASWAALEIAETLAYLSVKKLMDFLSQELRYSHLKIVRSILKKKSVLTHFIYLIILILGGHFGGHY